MTDGPERYGANGFAVLAYQDHSWIRVSVDPLSWKEAHAMAMDLLFPPAGEPVTCEGTRTIQIEDAPDFGDAVYADGEPPAWEL